MNIEDTGASHWRRREHVPHNLISQRKSWSRPGKETYYCPTSSPPFRGRADAGTGANYVRATPSPPNPMRGEAVSPDGLGRLRLPAENEAMKRGNLPWKNPAPTPPTRHQLDLLGCSTTGNANSPRRSRFYAGTSTLLSCTERMAYRAEAPSTGAKLPNRAGCRGNEDGGTLALSQSRRAATQTVEIRVTAYAEECTPT